MTKEDWIELLTDSPFAYITAFVFVVIAPYMLGLKIGERIKKNKKL